MKCKTCREHGNFLVPRKQFTLKANIQQGRWKFQCTLPYVSSQGIYLAICFSARYMEISIYIAKCFSARYMEISMYLPICFSTRYMEISMYLAMKHINYAYRYQLRRREIRSTFFKLTLPIIPFGFVAYVFSTPNTPHFGWAFRA